jgi:hypothetical protein
LYGTPQAVFGTPSRLFAWVHTGDILETDVLHTRREVIEAYERHTGFRGIGKFFADRGLIVIADEVQACPE